jgi:hypothetical protein
MPEKNENPIPPALKALIGVTYLNASYGMIGNRIEFTGSLLTHMGVAAYAKKDRMCMDQIKYARQQLHLAKGFLPNPMDWPEAEQICDGILITMGNFIFEQGYGTVDLKNFNPTGSASPSNVEVKK